MLKATFEPGVGITRPSGLRLIEQSGHHNIDLSPDLGTWELCDRSGRVLGDLHGFPIKGVVPELLEFSDRSITVRADVTDTDVFETLVLDALRGSYVILTHTDLPKRLYPDSNATLSVVYCSESRRAGSSADVIFDAAEYDARFLKSLHQRAVRQGHAADRWISGNLTAHEGLRRLLPNHYLDLESWSTTRFWPRPGEVPSGGGHAETVGIVSDRLRETISAAVRQHPSAGLALTAGFDSRLLLAASRPVAEQTDLFTVSSERRGLDPVMAGELARCLGLRHQVFPVLNANDAEQQAWDRALGHVVHNINRSMHPSVSQLNYDLIVTGLYGELGRSRLYQSEGAGIDGVEITPARLLARQGVSPEPEVLADAEEWLAGISWLPSHVILDLAVMERMYVSLWWPVHFALCNEVTPFADRVVQKAFIALSPEEKGRDALFLDCIRNLWPEVLELPINRFGDYRDHLTMIGKVMQPHKVAAFLRKKFT